MSPRSFRRVFHKDEFWIEQIKKQAASGLSIEAYCRQQGLAGSTFWRKHQRLARRRSGRPSTPTATTADAFVELALPAPGGLTIKLPSGVALELSGACDLQIVNLVLERCLRRR